MVLFQPLALIQRVRPPGYLIDGPYGVPLYIELYEPSTASYVLLLTPGGYQTTTCYRHIIKQFAETYRIVVWDPPMQGL